MAAQFFFIFKPLVFGKLKLINELWDIPEQTLLYGKWVDNDQFINQHHLIGLHNKYDIRHPSLTNSESCLSTKLSKNLKNFIGVHNKTARLALQDKNFDNPVYYYAQGQLCVIGMIPQNDLKILKLLLSDGVQNNSQKTAISLWLNLHAHYDTSLQTPSPYRLLSIRERQFMELNKFEYHWKVLNRYFIHHQNFVLGPINAIYLGQNIHKIFAQYGYLNSLALKTLLEHFGGINYQTYTKVTFSFYYVYYGLLLFLLFIVFRDVRYVLLTFTTSVFALNVVNYTFLAIGPGINPLRHFFDLFVILCFYAYLRKHRFIYLLMMLVFSGLAILNNNNFGIFLLVSLTITLLIKSLLEHRSTLKTIVFIIMSFIVSVICLKYSAITKNVMSPYYLKGMLGFPYNGLYVSLVFLAVGIYYLIIIRTLEQKKQFAYLGLFTILYTQGIFLYYIWGSDIGHLMVLMQIFALTAYIGLKLLIDSFVSLKKHETLILNLFIAFTFTFYLISAAYNSLIQYSIANIFKHHKTYEWNLDSAKFISTMNPAYFMDTLNLIKNYSKHTNGIYIISKYDNFLPILARKYSEMPYFDVPWFTLSAKEVEECIETILKNKPKYLFVDTDISRPYALDIVSAHRGSLINEHDESIMRYARLYELKKIYNAVKNQYKPIEKARLITVYERKTNKNNS